ncbi:MAG: CDP-alcohol phosphatidyltransferase family protein [Gammaproteobacteria bacterium]
MNEPDNTGQQPPAKTYVHIFARWCIRPLVNTPVTPNHLTTLRLLTGLAAAAAFAAGDYFWTFSGGVLFLISAILDRADGELARLSGRMSKGGHWYDLYCDMIVNAAIFIGMGIGLGQSGAIPGYWGPIMGLVAGLSVGAIFQVVFRLHEIGSHPGIAFKYPDGFDMDDSLFVVVIFAWFDALLILLIMAVIVAPLFLILAIWRLHTLQKSTRG